MGRAGLGARLGGQELEHWVKKAVSAWQEKEVRERVTRSWAVAASKIVSVKSLIKVEAEVPVNKSKAKIHQRFTFS